MKSHETAKSDAYEPELTLRPDPGNPLNMMRQQADIDIDFMVKMWKVIDPWDQSKAQRYFDLQAKYEKIIMDEPTLFLQPQNLEMTREEARTLAYK